MPINFDNYKNIKDKFDSLYTFVVYNTTNEDVIDKIKKISKTLDNITDNKRKNYLKHRMSEFEQYITKNSDNQVLNRIYFVGNEINFELLDKEAINTLKFFDHHKISFVYSNTFDINWLNNLLYNKDYYNVFHIQNNDVKYFILSETKKKIIYTSSKNTDIKKTIYDNILKTDKIPKYLVYGSIKGYQDNSCIGVINKELTDEEIINYFQMDTYKKNNEELKELLGKLTVPKFIDKIVFGTDILEQLEFSMIEKLYILDNHNDLEKIKMYNTEIKLVKSFEKCDIIDNFKNSYNGILGIKYY